jgi:hypothetical protein
MIPQASAAPRSGDLRDCVATPVRHARPDHSGEVGEDVDCDHHAPDGEADRVQLLQWAAAVSNDDQGDAAAEERQRRDDEERR